MRLVKYLCLKNIVKLAITMQLCYFISCEKGALL